MGSLSFRLPSFPWDTIAEAKKIAASHPDGICDLSVGTPVDPTPEIVQEALKSVSDAHGYPTTWGSAELREAISAYMSRRWNADIADEHSILPVIGTKELVAWLPLQLGLGSEDAIVIPTTAYPTYEVGARLAGCRLIAADDPSQIAGRPRLIWINSPANPHGAISTPQQMREWVDYARHIGAVLASDECYGEFAWDRKAFSIADRAIGGSLDNIIVVNSLSKRSNMAGYRAGYLCGDMHVIRELLEIRKHAGMIVPQPIQAAMIAALSDHDHVALQRERYQRRREALRQALVTAGFTIDHSYGSLYLWVRREGQSGREILDWFAQRGILIAPGDFYGRDASAYVRVAFTATDERIQAAVRRLS